MEALKNRKTEREDEFDTFGKYIATEFRSLPDRTAAQRVRFKLARCLMDSIEAENNINKPVYVIDGNMMLSQVFHNQQEHQSLLNQQSQSTFISQEDTYIEQDVEEQEE